MAYPPVYDLVRRLRRRTGIDFDPHWYPHKLMAVVRPEFRAHELVFDPADPVFGGGIWRVDGCGRTARGHGLCQAHRNRLIRYRAVPAWRADWRGGRHRSAAVMAVSVGVAGGAADQRRAARDRWGEEVRCAG